MPRARIGRALSDRALSVRGTVEQQVSALVDRLQREHDPTLRELIRSIENGVITWLVDGTEIATQAALNLIAGKDITITAVDNTGESRVDATIARADKALNSASVSGAISFDLSGVGRHFRRTLTGDVTAITVSAAPVEVGNWVFDFVQGGAGGYILPVATASWPTSSTFTDSTPPVIDATLGGHNWVTLYFDGTLYHWLTGCNPSIAV